MKSVSFCVWMYSLLINIVFSRMHEQIHDRLLYNYQHIRYTLQNHEMSKNMKTINFYCFCDIKNKLPNILFEHENVLNEFVVFIYEIGCKLLFLMSIKSKNITKEDIKI